MSCKHDYEYIPFCATRVCNLCQDHAGKDCCNNCTWRRPPGEETTPFYEHGKSAGPKDEHLDQNDLVGWVDEYEDDLFSVDITPELARCIAGVEEDLTNNGKTIKIKFHDSQRALEALAKIKGLYKEVEGRGHAVVQFINYDQKDEE